jgi:hypothetical protein
MSRVTPHKRDLRGARGPGAALFGSRRKRVSAMVRVRNEEEFLVASVRSIAPFVEEIVILDNASTDATPELIRSLARELPAVRTASYPHKIARVGSEKLAVVRAERRPSPGLMSTYSNWAMRQCSCPFILRWDADMIATDGFAAAIEEWHAGRYVSLALGGVNLHPDRDHLLAPRSQRPEVVGRGLIGGPPPRWTLEMTYADHEVRLFPRFLLRFDDGLWWCARQGSPFTHPLVAKHLQLEVSDPVYLHLKYCKRAPHTNQSPEFASMIQRNIAVGPPLAPSWRETLRTHGLLD